MSVAPLAVPVAVKEMPAADPDVEKLFPFHCTLLTGTLMGMPAEETVKLLWPTTDMFF